MKHLKSSFRNLRQVFDQSVSVRYVAEPLASFDAQRYSLDVLAFMNNKDFDVVGVRHNGVVIGYVHREDLQEGTLEKYTKPFDKQFLMDDWSPLLVVLELLVESPQVFIVIMGEVSGIITKGDLQKAPVRMWLFGILSLLEMQFLRLIRALYPRDTWRKFISENRLSKAQEILRARKRNNEAIDLADCLQFGDKISIVLKSNTLRREMGFPSTAKGREILKAFEHIRNELAHAQDIITGRWPELVKLVKKAEDLLATCEALEPEAEG